MRHYEIVCIVHVKHSNNILNIINCYKKIVSVSNGKIHRIENWGKIKLSYKIKKLKIAHYFCLNVEINKDTLFNIENNLKFNNTILRYLIVKIKSFNLGKSLMMKNLEKETELNKIINNK